MDLFRSLSVELGLWAVMTTVLADGNGAGKLDGEALAWVQRQYQAALDRADERIAAQASHTPGRVESIVAGYTDAIGDVEQTLPGEEWGLDSIIRNDSPTPAHPTPVHFAGATDRVEIPRPRSFDGNGYGTQTFVSAPAGAGSLGESNAQGVMPESRLGGNQIFASAMTIAQPAMDSSSPRKTPPRRVPPKRPGSNGGIGGTRTVASTQVARTNTESTPRGMAADQISGSTNVQNNDRGVSAPTAPATDLEAILSALIGWYTRSANVPADRVTPDAPLTTLGLDSLTATEISVNIEEHYGVILKPAALWDCPNLRAVAEHVERAK